MARLTIKPKVLVTKKMRGQSAKASNANKRVNKSQVFNFYLIFGLISLKNQRNVNRLKTIKEL